jgi:RNase P/RNase MRP subunit POP5
MKRAKRRYLALQLEYEGVPNERELMETIWGSVTKLFGEVGASLTGLVLINLDVEHKIAVVKCSLISLPSVHASLATITQVASKDAAVHVLAISGTLKALLDILNV